MYIKEIIKYKKKRFVFHLRFNQIIFTFYSQHTFHVQRYHIEFVIELKSS